MSRDASTREDDGRHRQSMFWKAASLARGADGVELGGHAGLGMVCSVGGRRKVMDASERELGTLVSPNGREGRTRRAAEPKWEGLWVIEGIASSHDQIRWTGLEASG